jgi:hypothetical protein
MIPAIWKRAALLWILVLAACTVQLAPAYDQALAEGLDQANIETLTLFAALERGSPHARFSDYEDRYAAVIGRFEALRQRAAGREIPPLAARLSRLGPIQHICTTAADPTACVNASPASLAEVLAVLRQMRDTHRLRDLAADDVENFRNAYNPAIAQALTVENALKR